MLLPLIIFKMENNKITLASRITLLVIAVLFFSSLKFPMWRIELDAPQYPEGLVLQLHADKIGGDVEVINGLNHYIGMKTLHTEDFIEFQIIPYIIYFFVLFALINFLWANKKGVKWLFGAIILFAVIAGADFYRWNYDYGHNLDPTAAIKVPGMAYQPPVLGYKQLLNFGAYSIPDIGGWMLILAAILLFVILTFELGWYEKLLKKNAVKMLLIFPFFSLMSCISYNPEPIKLHVDQCEFCKMSISDNKFGAELITDKGRIYKFDDIRCMAEYTLEKKQNIKSFFVHDYAKDNELIPAETAFFIRSDELNSPMRGNIAAFDNKENFNQFLEKFQAKELDWNAVLNLYK